MFGVEILAVWATCQPTRCRMGSLSGHEIRPVAGQTRRGRLANHDGAGRPLRGGDVNRRAGDEVVVADIGPAFEPVVDPRDGQRLNGRRALGLRNPATRYATNWMSGLPPCIASICTPSTRTTPLNLSGRASESCWFALLLELKKLVGAPITRTGMYLPPSLFSYAANLVNAFGNTSPLGTPCSRMTPTRLAAAPLSTA